MATESVTAVPLAVAQFELILAARPGPAVGIGPIRQTARCGAAATTCMEVNRACVERCGATAVNR